MLATCAKVEEDRPTASKPATPDQDPRLYLRGDIRGEVVCLRIVDFVPNIAHEESTEEEIGHGENGTTIFVRKTKKKLTPQEVSPAQWITANARIQFELMSSGTLNDEDVTDYLGYTAKIGQYATLYTWQSVMAFDAAYRQSQAALGFRWGSESQHLVNLHLKRRQLPGPTSPSGKTALTSHRPTAAGTKHKSQPAQGPFMSTGQEICRRFNDGNCKLVHCKRVHVCRFPSCGENHPVFQHGTKIAVPQ